MCHFWERAVVFSDSIMSVCGVCVCVRSDPAVVVYKSTFTANSFKLCNVRNTDCVCPQLCLGDIV